MFEKRNDDLSEPNEFPSDALSALYLAKRLRNASLFREAFVHVVGLWDPDKTGRHLIGIYPDIERLVLREHASLCKGHGHTTNHHG